MQAILRHTIDSDITQRSRAIVLHVGVSRIEQADKDGDGARIDQLLSVFIWNMEYEFPSMAFRREGGEIGILNAPEWVILSSAPVAFRCTRISLDRASRVRGTRAPDLAIFVLLSSTKEFQLPAHGTRAPKAIPCVARLVTHPTALHCTSTLGLSIWRMRGSSPPNLTISNLFSAIPGLSAENGPRVID